MMKASKTYGTNDYKLYQKLCGNTITNMLWGLEHFPSAQDCRWCHETAQITTILFYTMCCCLGTYSKWSLSKRNSLQKVTFFEACFSSLRNWKHECESIFVMLSRRNSRSWLHSSRLKILLFGHPQSKVLSVAPHQL